MRTNPSPAAHNMAEEIFSMMDPNILRDNAEKVEGHYLEIKLDSIETALEERDKAEAIGIHI